MPNCTFRGAKIFLVDDHPAVRQGLSLLLIQEGLIVCGESENSEQTFQRLPNASPDLVLVDLSLGNESGLDLIEELHVRGIKSIAYTMHNDARYIESAFAVGAVGYVTKREIAGILLDAIREALSGRRYVSPIAAESLSTKLIPKDNRIQIEKLSMSELKIFQRLAEGDTTLDISERFQISAETVEIYFSKIIEKLGLSDTEDMRRQAVLFMRKI